MMLTASRTSVKPGTGEFGQVLQFPQRRMATPRPAILPAFDAAPATDLSDDLARYEQEGPVDYRHRALMNLIAVVIVTLLIASGVWIADTIADMQRDQDCLLQGRMNCAPIEVTVSNRQ